jgi:hypothetical protein
MSKLAPIVPVVAKSDSMTITERNVFVYQLSVQFEKMQRLSNRAILYDFGDTYLQELLFSESGSPVCDIDENSSAFMNIGSFLDAQASIPHLDQEEGYDTHPGISDDACRSFVTEARPVPAFFDISLKDEEKVERVKGIFSIICDTSGSRVYPWGDVW